MRLLITTDTVGGVWTFTRELTQQLLERGHQVHLVSFGGRPTKDHTASADQLRAAFPAQFGFTASDIPLEWMQNNEAAHSQGEQLLQYVLRSAAAPDLIVSNQFCFGRLNTTIPRVVVAHSDVLSWGKAVKPSALEPTPWLNRYTSMVQAGLLDAAAVIAPTQWMGKALVSNFFLPHSFLVIPNGATAAEPASGTTPTRKLQAITAGRFWDEAKGLGTLLDLNEPPFPLLLAGEDTPGAHTANSADTNHLQWLGPLSSPALHQQFRESAIYLCPSLYEPFGLAPLEAALCGCAIVARDLPSLREVWGEAALYFADQPSLTSTLQALAADADLLRQSQVRAESRAALFTPERMVSSYLHLFQTVLQQHSPGQHAA